jgi:chromosome segregation ATPase
MYGGMAGSNAREETEMTATRDAEDDSLEQFKQRMDELRGELRSINGELGHPDLLTLAFRTRELLRRTKGLLDGNVTILFANQPERVYADLYDHIHFAEGHIKKALSEECEFETIKRRLYMATALSEYVINHVSVAIENVRTLYEKAGL